MVGLCRVWCEISCALLLIGDTGRTPLSIGAGDISGIDDDCVCDGKSSDVSESDSNDTGAGIGATKSWGKGDGMFAAGVSDGVCCDCDSIGVRLFRTGDGAGSD